MTLKGYFTLNAVLFCQVTFKICFFPYTESAIISILGIYNIFGELEGHNSLGDMHKPEASKYFKTWNI